MICDRCSIVCQFAGEPGECKGVSVSGVQCKKCRYLLKDKEGYNWCPNKTDDPDIDLIRDCEWYAVKTNADRIRSMTDEELAEWFAGHDAGLIANVLNNDYVEPTKDGWLEWLKQ